MAGKGIFEDVKILEFGQIVAGPLISTYLADYGAEVAHIESHKRPDQYRLYPPFKDNKPGINRGFDFAVYSHNKYGITLNLRHPKGVEVAKRVLKNWANVVVENFTPGVMKRLGLDYEELKKVKPDLIMLSSCNLGQTGPYAKHPGMGSHLTHLSGFTHLSGWPDRDPLILYGPYIDFIGVIYGTASLVSALEYRRRTGKGQYIDVAQLEGGVQFLSSAVLDYAVNGRIQGRQGNRCDYAAPHGAYPCKGEDRWCVIAAFTDNEWEALCRVMGEPAQTKDSKFSTFAGRKRNEEELNRVIAEWTSKLTAEEVMDKLQAVGVEGAVVKDMREMYEDPHLKNYLWAEMDHPEIGKYHVQMPPFKMSKIPIQLRMTSPGLGQHNEYVFKDLAGLSEKEYSELDQEGVFE
ncbi:CoA-transferase family III protein [delta proteobacterium NaphS2]|nr:CoA-transferase family III protein [delta proteobacterium NaphS2]